MRKKSKTLRLFTLTGKEQGKQLVSQLQHKTRRRLTRVMRLSARRSVGPAEGYFRANARSTNAPTAGPIAREYSCDRWLAS